MKNDQRRRVSIRNPVRRKGASRYILFSLLSFALSVSLTRLFLQLTGYPRLGSGELHIAHVLWGGLLLFIAALIPLLYANRWAYTVSALINGAGVGLFIDEVGKFITANNNYFYPAAAPIVYALFLITVMVYMQARIPRSERVDPRTEMYSVIDELEEVLDHDLSADERNEIIEHLRHINKETDDENLSRLGKSLESFIESDQLVIVPHVPDLQERILVWISSLAERIITARRLRYFVLAGLFGSGFWAIFTPVKIIVDSFSPEILPLDIMSQVIAGNIRGQVSLKSFEIQIGLELAVGLVLLFAAVLLALGRERQGIAYAYLSLLILLTVVNLFVFYFDQFSTIISALIQLVVFISVTYYRNHYIPLGSA